MFIALAPADSSCSHGGTFGCGLVKLTTPITSGASVSRRFSTSMSVGWAFGFFRANGTGVSGPGYTLSAGIDNWRVTIAAAGLPVAAAVPTLGGCALLAFGIALIGFAWTRRAR